MRIKFALMWMALCSVIFALLRTVSNGYLFFIPLLAFVFFYFSATNDVIEESWDDLERQAIAQRLIAEFNNKKTVLAVTPQEKITELPESRLNNID